MEARKEGLSKLQGTQDKVADAAKQRGALGKLLVAPFRVRPGKILEEGSRKGPVMGEGARTSLYPWQAARGRD